MVAPFAAGLIYVSEIPFWGHGLPGILSQKKPNICGNLCPNLI